MRRRIWLFVLVLYAAAGIVDGAYHIAAPPSGAHSSTGAALAVAFCAGLFWPIDIVARPLLLSR
jgi:phosphate/sulfate permease